MAPTRVFVPGSPGIDAPSLTMRTGRVAAATGVPAAGGGSPSCANVTMGLRVHHH